MKTSAQMSPAVLMALGTGLMPTRLRNALDTMSTRQRKLIRLPHVGAKEIAKHAAREAAAHREWINSVEAEILEKNKGVYIV